MPIENQPRVARPRRYWVKAAMIILGCLAVFVGTLFAVNSYIDYLYEKEAAKGPQIVGDGDIVIYGEPPPLPLCDPDMDFEFSFDTIDQTSKFNCDFEGWELVLNENITLSVPEIGNMTQTGNYSSSSREEWAIANFGKDFGVVIYTTTQLWGGQRAQDLIREAGWQETLAESICEDCR